MGERRYGEVLGNEVEIVGEEVVENEEEARPVDTLPTPYICRRNPNGTTTS